MPRLLAFTDMNFLAHGKRGMWYNVEHMDEHLLNKDYRDMIVCLLQAGVDFMLVGGYAVALHGWPRTTFDIDFWIMANPENAKSVMCAIRAFGAPLMDLEESDFHWTSERHCGRRGARKTQGKDRQWIELSSR